VNKAQSLPHPSSAFGTTDLLLLLTSFIWGTNYAVIKFDLEDFLPLAFSGPRFLIASICMAAALAISRQGFKLERRHILPMFLFGLSSSTINQSLVTIGMTYTKAGNAALILSTAPIFTAILSRLRKHETFTRRAVIGLLIAFAGIVLIIVAGTKEVNFRESLKGDLMMLAGAVFWAIYTIGTGKYAHIYGPIKTATMMMLMGTPVLLLVSTPMLIQQNWAAVRPVSWVGLVASGVLSIALSFILWNQGVRKIGATRTAIYSNLQPIFALLAAWVMVHEMPTIGQITGTGVTLIGIYLVRGGMLPATVEEELEAEEEEINLGFGKG
jgi:drug/metabolite transporter (DMT)-like permease